MSKYRFSKVWQAQGFVKYVATDGQGIPVGEHVKYGTQCGRLVQSSCGISIQSVAHKAGH